MNEEYLLSEIEEIKIDIKSSRHDLALKRCRAILDESSSVTKKAENRVLELKNIMQSEALLNTSLHRERNRLEQELKEVGLKHDRLLIEKIGLEFTVKELEGYRNTIAKTQRVQMELSNIANERLKERNYWFNRYAQTEEALDALKLVCKKRQDASAFISKLKELTGMAAKGTVLEAVHVMILKYENKEAKYAPKTRP